MRPLPTTNLIAIAMTILAATAVAACGSESGGGSEATVTATTGILADITERVAGPDAEVEQVIPDSASPHDFSLSAEDRAQLEDSSLLVENGAQLEAGLPLDELDVPTYALADHVGDLLGGEDPHVWMDPSRVAAALPSLADALAEADPEHADGYRSRAAAYAKELRSLDAQLEDSLAAVQPSQRELVTSHDALGYFADRYGFDVVATPFPSSGPEAEASAQSVQEVEEAIDRTGVPAVFAEESDDQQVLEQIADRRGVEIIDGLLVESPGSAGSYVEMLRTDAELIAQGLAPAGADGS